MLGRCQPLLLTNGLIPPSLVPTTALSEMPNPETECRRSSRHGVCGEDQKPRRGEGRTVAKLA
nr:putative integron gene cassette protein [uncultured bacterium]